MVHVGNRCDASLTFCFDVLEVQAWILKHEAANSNIDNQMIECPMFGVEQIRKVIFGTEVTIPDKMPQEFALVITNFTTLSTSETQGKKDPIANMVRNAMKDFVEAKIASSTSEDDIKQQNSWLGTFWAYTKRAFAYIRKNSLRFVLKMMESPYYMLAIVTISRLTRVLICSLMCAKDAPTAIIKGLFYSLKSEFGDMWGGIPRFCLNLAEQLMLCSQMTGAWDGIACAAQLASIGGQLATTLGGSSITSSFAILTSYVSGTVITQCTRLGVVDMFATASPSALFHQVM